MQKACGHPATELFKRKFYPSQKQLFRATVFFKLALTVASRLKSDVRFIIDQTPLPAGRLKIPARAMIAETSF